jgi:hypothetical protein
VADAFNPYQEWLGLADLAHQPNYYELFGLATGESDAAVIAKAADNAMARVRGCRPGGHAAQWADLLDELDRAKACLIDPGSKTRYDRQLAGSSAPSASAPMTAPAPRSDALSSPPGGGQPPVDPANLQPPGSPVKSSLPPGAVPMTIPGAVDGVIPGAVPVSSPSPPTNDTAPSVGSVPMGRPDASNVPQAESPQQADGTWSRPQPRGPVSQPEAPAPMDDQGVLPGQPLSGQPLPGQPLPGQPFPSTPRGMPADPNAPGVGCAC